MSMKALYILEPKRVEIREVPAPKRAPGEALLKLRYGGICGSDLGSYRGTFAYFSYPRIPGHEFSAEIVEIDENDAGLRPGMLVTANPYFNCGSCYSCERGIVNACMDNQTMGCQRDGAFCEYITMPIKRLYAGKTLSAKALATVEPYCIGAHGVSRAGVHAGQKVLVLGGGTIGLMAAIAAKSRGAQVYLCDVPQAEEKIRRSQETFGFAGVVLNESPEALEAVVRRVTGSRTINGKQQGNGFDVCIEAVGLPSTFQSCVDCCAFGGTVALIGVGKQNLDFNFTAIQKKELNIVGSRNALKQDFLVAIDAEAAGQLNLEKAITNVYGFSEAAQAFEDFSQNRGRMIKVLLDFSKV